MLKRAEGECAPAPIAGEATARYSYDTQQAGDVENAGGEATHGSR